jgi:thiamine-phosphate pyrophosphorylase
MSAGLKRVRHDLASSTRWFLADAILCRDTPGDVGTSIKLQTEFTRESIADVVTAAGKRLGEALRAMEEFSKPLRPESAAEIEKLRYRFYDLEQLIARTLRPLDKFASVRLYVLITESACRQPWLKVAHAAIAGGADALQLREKDLESGELLKRAKVLAHLCRQAGVLLIMNDRPDIAVLSDADGVHVGQVDLPAVEARRIVGHDRIVGVSTHEISQAQQAVRDGADYIGVGPIFRSKTKPRDWETIPGLDYAKRVSGEVSIPIVGIAGIDLSNVEEVLSSGVQRIAVTAAITGCDDVEAATRKMKEKLVRPGA